MLESIAGKYEVKVYRQILSIKDDKLTGIMVESNKVEFVITDEEVKPSTTAPHPSPASQSASH